jgi:hypothetical protein
MLPEPSNASLSLQSQAPHTSSVEDHQQLNTGIAVRGLESSGGGANVGTAQKISSGIINTSSSSVTVASNTGQSAAPATPSKDDAPSTLSLKQSSWPPQPDDSPRHSPASSHSAPQILRDFFALSVV